MHGHRIPLPKYNPSNTDNESNNKWDLLKLRSFCKEQDIVNKTKRQPIEWEKIFTKPIEDKRLISKIYKELNKLESKISNNPIKNGVIN